jgi:serine protease Do
MKRAYVFLAILGLCFAATEGQAQLGSSKQLIGLFRDVIAKPHQSTVRVKADGKDVALGVIVSADGWILSKYSELKGKKEIICKLPDGTELEAEMFGKDEPSDLVMLKVDPSELTLTPVAWTDSKVSKVGHWVASVGDGADPVAIGVVSVATREVKGAKFVAPTGVPGGYLGIALDLDFIGGIKVQEVLKDAPAIKAGVKIADQIVAVNGEMVQDPEEFLGVLSRKKPGDTVTLKIVRDDKELELKVPLAERPGTKGGKSRGEQQNSMGSKLSERKAGFPVILQHDSVLKPTDCGGPLVNLDGKVVGINISRAGRTETYAVPSEAIRPLLERLKTRTPDTKEKKK